MNCVHCYTNYYVYKKFARASFVWQGNSLCEKHYQAAIGYEEPTDGKDNDNNI